MVCAEDRGKRSGTKGRESRGLCMCNDGFGRSVGLGPRAGLFGVAQRLAFGLLALALLAGAAAAADGKAGEPMPRGETQPLEIVSKTGVHVFAVELVVKDADRARGLMFRKE